LKNGFIGFEGVFFLRMNYGSTHCIISLNQVIIFALRRRRIHIVSKEKGNYKKPRFFIGISMF